MGGSSLKVLSPPYFFSKLVQAFDDIGAEPQEYMRSRIHGNYRESEEYVQKHNSLMLSHLAFFRGNFTISVVAIHLGAYDEGVCSSRQVERNIFARDNFFQKGQRILRTEKNSQKQKRTIDLTKERNVGQNGTLYYVGTSRVYRQKDTGVCARGARGGGE